MRMPFLLMAVESKTMWAWRQDESEAIALQYPTWQECIKVDNRLSQLLLLSSVDMWKSTLISCLVDFAGHDSIDHPMIGWSGVKREL